MCVGRSLTTGECGCRRGKTDIQPDLSVFDEPATSEPSETPTSDPAPTPTGARFESGSVVSKDIGAVRDNRTIFLAHVWLVAIGHPRNADPSFDNGTDACTGFGLFGVAAALTERIGRGWRDWRKGHLFMQILSTSFVFIGEIIALAHAEARSLLESIHSSRRVIGTRRLCSWRARLSLVLYIPSAGFAEFEYVQQRSMGSWMEEAQSSRRLCRLCPRLLSSVDVIASVGCQRHRLSTVLRVHYRDHRQNLLPTFGLLNRQRRQFCYSSREAQTRQDSCR